MGTRASLLEIAGVFLKLGTLGFGGPPAHLAMMERELVDRRGWVSRERLLDLIGAANLVPGPNSTEVAIALGRERGGWSGLLVAGACFILPAALITALLAAAYVRYGSLPEFTGFLRGMNAAVVGVIAVVAGRLAKTAAKAPMLAAVLAGSAVAATVGAPPVAVLLISGAFSSFAARRRHLAPVALVPVFLYFLHVGATIYGGGFVLVAYLERDLVRELGWLSNPQVLDAIAVGQVTPGPVFSTATFLGYLLAGPAGAAVATLGIFLPSFLFVAVFDPLLRWSRGNPTAAATLDGVNAAAVGLIASAALTLVPTSIHRPAGVIIAALAVLAGLLTKLNPGIVVLIGGVLGLLSHP